MKKRIFISWLALKTDFVQNSTEVDTTGPNYEFHKLYFKDGSYDKHLLLTASKSENADEQGVLTEHLRTRLQKDFPKHNLEVKYLYLEDIINLEQILRRVQPLLLDLSIQYE